VVLCVVLLLLHSSVIWFYHGLNFATAMLLFTIVLLHTILCLALVFWFSLQMDYAENCICVCLSILLVYLLCICINSVLQDLSSSKTTTQTNQGFVFIK